MLIIMAAQFNSITQPLIIFMAVIFAFWGAVMGLFLIRSPFSINNLFGLVALAGVAVNNSIVLISFVNRMRERGAGRLRAVLKAGNLRVRPILLTSVTTILGLLPMAIGLGGYSEVWGPLATVMVCGLTASSLLSLFLIPSLYLVFGDIKKLFFRRRRRDREFVRQQWKERAARRRELAEVDSQGY
jgi:HAE1 family hydrophobic/amphiphilic exporter-1